MNSHLFSNGLVAAALLAATTLPAGPATARTTGLDVGSAIAPAFSIRHAAMRPFEDVTLVLGVHDDNPHATRALASGDAFHFDFATGTLGECVVVSALSPSGALDASDWRCIVDGQRATLQHDGDGGAWPHGDAIFAELRFGAPARSTVVRTGHDVGIVGAYSPPSPGAIVLGVSPDIGSVGPEGPEGPVGPTGPQGPVGPSATANVVRATSARSVSAHRDDAAPTPIPGLEASIDLAGGSRLLALTSVPGHDECASAGSAGVALLLEVNGELVEKRVRDWDAGAVGTDAELLWLSESLVGPQTVRVLIEHAGGQPVTGCYGGTVESGLAGHLLLLEIRQ